VSAPFRARSKTSVYAFDRNGFFKVFVICPILLNGMEKGSTEIAKGTALYHCVSHAIWEATMPTHDNPDPGDRFVRQVI
jgi:hypothetical protein